MSVLSFSDASTEPCLPYVCDLLVQSLQTFQTCYARIGIYSRPRPKLATFIIRCYLPANRLQDPSLCIIPTQTRTNKSDRIPKCNVDEVMLLTKLILWGLIMLRQKPVKVYTFIRVCVCVRNAPLIHPHASRLHLMRHACALASDETNTVCYFAEFDACGANPFSLHPAPWAPFAPRLPLNPLWSSMGRFVQSLHLQKGH